MLFGASRYHRGYTQYRIEESSERTQPGSGGRVLYFMGRARDRIQSATSSSDR